MNPNHGALIWKLTRTLREPGSPEENLSRALGDICGALGFEEASLWLLNVRDSRIYIVASLGSRDRLGAYLDLDRGLPGAVTRSAQPVLIADCATDPRFAGARGENIPRNLLLAPLKTAYDCLGCLQLSDKIGGDLNQEDYQSCLLAASLIAQSLSERGLAQPAPEKRNLLLSLQDIQMPVLPEDPFEAPLSGISLNIYEGEWLALLGERGCGSRNLMALLQLAVPPEGIEGRIMAMGKDLLRFSPEEREEYRRGFAAFLPADCPLIPTMSLKANVELVSRRCLEPMDPEEALKLAGLEGLGGKLPRDLDALQRARVGIARALARKALLILAEEPGQGLAPQEVRSLLESLKGAAEKLGAALVMSTASEEKSRAANRVLHMQTGRPGRLSVNPRPKAPGDLIW